MPLTELSPAPFAAPHRPSISPLEILDNMAEEVVVLDATGTIVWVNEEWRRFARSNGAGEQRWEGVDYLGACRDRLPGTDEPDLLAINVREGVRRVLAGEDAELRLEYPCHSPTEERWFLLAVRSLSGGAAVLSHFVITERKRRERELQRLSLRDPLTGLPNRRSVVEHLERLAERGEVPESAAVVMLDLDGFKAVNDTWGHAAGDRLLRAVALRLVTTLRRDDLLARMGGDEFLVLLGGVGRETAVPALERIERTLSAPFDVGEGQQVTIGVSAGAAYFPDQGSNLPDLVALADAELYAVKRGRRAAQRRQKETPNSASTE
jgi:diguanylate cyclase (GGDEF)-like protein